MNGGDIMRNGVALHITDIRPDTKIESEIFFRQDHFLFKLNEALTFITNGQIFLKFDYPRCL